ncbi:hypothetical protein ALP35_00083 [Pseudomonas savastanoi pv. glycinea]|nr:hypothetical protein ALP35_00083 [Pseudomonas savastanoi pv. glycinea]
MRAGVPLHSSRLPYLHILRIHRLGQQARCQEGIGDMLLLVQLLMRDRLYLIGAVAVGDLDRLNIQIAP